MDFISHNWVVSINDNLNTLTFSNNQDSNHHIVVVGVAVVADILLVAVVEGVVVVAVLVVDMDYTLVDILDIVVVPCMD